MLTLLFPSHYFSYILFLPSKQKQFEGSIFSLFNNIVEEKEGEDRDEYLFI